MVRIVLQIFSILNILVLINLIPLSQMVAKVDGYPVHSEGWNWLLENLSDISRQTHPVIRPPFRPPSKVVFPVPEDVVMNRSYLPDLGFLTDLAFLFFLPRDVPASGLVRLSRDLFESEQCVQYVSCEMTKVAQRHRSLEWVNNFLQDFPFQGDVADRLRQGSMDTISKFNKRKTIIAGGNVGNSTKMRREDEDLCTFSCHPIGSLTKGLRMLGLLHDLVKTVK